MLIFLKISEPVFIRIATGIISQRIQVVLGFPTIQHPVAIRIRQQRICSVRDFCPIP